MTQWTQQEFEALLDHADGSDADLLKVVPARSVGAIGVVRSGSHSFHENRDISMLSGMMVAVLRERRGRNACPKCGITF